MVSCYLHIVIDTATCKVVGAGFYQDHCLTMTLPGRETATLVSIAAESWEQARKEMVHRVSQFTVYQWVVPLLREEDRTSIDAFRANLRYPPGDPRHVPPVGTHVIRFVDQNTGNILYDVQDSKVTADRTLATRRTLLVSNIRVGLLRERYAWADEFVVEEA